MSHVDLRRVSTAITPVQKMAVCPLDEVKMQLRITSSDEDSLLQEYIVVAYDFLSGPDGWLNGCCLLAETWEMYLASNIQPRFELPLRPIASNTVSLFDIVNSDDTFTAVDPEIFHVVPGGAFSAIQRSVTTPWPYTGTFSHRTYRVRFVAGYTTAADIPAPLKLAMKMLVAHWYRNREAVGTAGDEIQFGLRALAGRYRAPFDH
jgi:uncharacterized phiE125 gp8 family phage protein